MRLDPTLVLGRSWWLPDAAVREAGHPVARRKQGAAVIRGAMPFVDKRRVAIQAGGHLGLWPWLLAEQFARVLTFEPDADNFACLERNVEPRKRRIRARCAALGDAPRQITMAQGNSTGQHHVDLADGECPMVTIDSLGADADAILLDVEGYELFALRGAARTLRKHHPVIVVEENTCSARYGVPSGEIAKYLKPFGYKVRQRFGDDIVFF